MKKFYIHYGSSEFYRKLFKPIKNKMLFTKPEGGLWASPINAEDGWKEWCIRNNFHTNRLEKSFIFTLKPETRLLFVDDIKQLEDLPKVENPAVFENFNLWTCLDFEKLMEDYDAMEITLSKEKRHRYEFKDGFWGGLYDKLYGWDCDSICIMNPDCIETHPEMTITPIVEQVPEEPKDTYKRYRVKGYKIN